MPSLKKTEWIVSLRGRPISHTVVAGILLFALASTAFAPPCRAGQSEERMLSITKTTIYGALLGGLLGLASSLVVREGYEDDAVRWGIAIGSFAGFTYGVISPPDDDFDDFSLRRQRHDPRWYGRLAPAEEDRRTGWFGGRLCSTLNGEGRILTVRAEVKDGDLEEEDIGEEGGFESTGRAQEVGHPEGQIGP